MKREGSSTESVDFLTSRDVLDVLQGNGIARGWAYHTTTWKPGQRVILPLSPRPDSPYRMCFAVDADSSVVPLQQCVDCRFEKNHTVDASSWNRNMNSLAGAWLFGPILSYLDDVVKGRRNDTSVDVRIEIEGPFRRWMGTATRPGAGRLVRASRCSTLSELENEAKADSGTVDHVLVIGRSSRADRWLVVFGSPFPINRNQRAAVNRKAEQSAFDYWCVVWSSYSST